ncbi:MAG: GGDEF domain-containing protein [Clostridia bacterium]|nr:GGDEF domain-containing protein [Clostridia bacterium]
MIVADWESGVILGSTVSAHMKRNMTELGTGSNWKPPGHEPDNFTADVDGIPSYCSISRVGDYTVLIVQDKNKINQSIPLTLSSLFLYLVLAGGTIAVIVVRMTRRIVAEHRNANTDTLTGLYNRRAYAEDMNRFEESPNYSEATYVSLDLNGLKIVNDNNGHEAGDELLRGAAQCIVECFGEYGTIYRVGGDEFVALLFMTKDEEAEARRKFEESMTDWSKHHKFELSISYGCAHASDYPGFSVEKLSNLADEMMYADKAAYYRKTGRDRRRT